MASRSRLRTEGNCSICLNAKSTDLAAISCCKHTFHKDCIQSWSQITNKCPLCKLCFSYITCLQSHQFIQVEHREQKLQRDDLSVDAIETDEYWNSIACQECKSTDPLFDQYALICDACNNVWHTFCTGLGYNVPVEDHWFCRKCSAFLFPAPNTNDAKHVNIVYYDDLSDFDINDELPEDAFSKHPVTDEDEEWVPNGYKSRSNDKTHAFGTITKDKKRIKKRRRMKRTKCRKRLCEKEQSVDSLLSLDTSDTVQEIECHTKHDRKVRKRKRDWNLNDDSPLKRRKIGHRHNYKEDINHNTQIRIQDDTFYGDIKLYDITEGVKCIKDKTGNKMWQFVFKKKRKKKKKKKSK